MLTAKAEEIDRIVGLEFGADDYVTKPFSPREVVLRIRAIMRRGEAKQGDERLTAGPITVDPARYEVSVSGKRINLTSLEFKLLCTLMQRRGVSRRVTACLTTYGVTKVSLTRAPWTRTSDGCARNLAKLPM